MYSLQLEKGLHLRKASFAVRALGSDGVAIRLLGSVTPGGHWAARWAAPAARPPRGARGVQGRRALSQLRLENTLAGCLEVLQGLEDFPLVAQGLLKPSLT
jgi:hypothetical protein